MRRSDIISGLGLLAVGFWVLFSVIPGQIAGSAFGGLSPDFFPRWIAIIFVVCAALLVLTRASDVLRGRPEPEDEAESPMRPVDFLFIAGTAAVLALAAWLMANVGYIAAGALVIGAAGLALGRDRRSLIQTGLTLLVAPVAIYFAFRHLFFVFLPG